MSHVFDTSDSAQRREALAAATNAIRSGRLVVLPTDTVYGVAADAFNAHAVSLLLTSKGRGRSMPAPVLIHRPEALEGVGADISPEVWALTREFWPGALTVIVHQQPTVSLDLGDAMGTVAVRMPNDDMALDLLALTGPLAVSSANRTGQPAARTAEEAQEQLAESVDVYLNDGSRAESGLPSTIVDATGDTLRVVREGAISLERLREVVPTILGLGEDVPPQEAEESSDAEGATEPAAESAVEDSAEPEAAEVAGSELPETEVSEFTAPAVQVPAEPEFSEPSETAAEPADIALPEQSLDADVDAPPASDPFSASDPSSASDAPSTRAPRRGIQSQPPQA